MFGIFLMLTGTFFEEVSTSIGKDGFKRHLESPFSFGFINSVLQTLLFAAVAIWRWDELHFSPQSLPYLALRIALEVILATITLQAIARADRSTFGFVRTLTIPLVLGVDFALGYAFGWLNLAGVCLIIGSLLWLFRNHGLKKRGLLLSLASAALAAVTISLFKYSITNFNSLEIDQLAANSVLLVYFFVMARVVYRENAWHRFFTARGLAQSGLSALGGLIEANAFMFAPASVIVAAKRALAVMWSVLSGRAVFHERRLSVKLAALFACAVGISLMAM